MGKKKSINLLYLIGCGLVVLGFCLPLFKGLGATPNGFKFLDFDNFGFVTIGGLTILAGGILGIISCFVPSLSKLKILWILISVAGGIILVIGFNDSWISKLVGKGFIKHAYIGFYTILVGWILGIVGAITNK